MARPSGSRSTASTTETLNDDETGDQPRQAEGGTGQDVGQVVDAEHHATRSYESSDRKPGADGRNTLCTRACEARREQAEQAEHGHSGRGMSARERERRREPDRAPQIGPRPRIPVLRREEIG